jgi:hypothetical protein
MARKSGSSTAAHHGTTVPAQPIEDIDDQVLGDRGDMTDDEDDMPAVSRPAVIPTDQARKVGAVNAEAVQNNRRRKAVIDRKRDGEKHVAWGERDACLLYDDIISVWPPHARLTHVTRISGTTLSWYLQAQPRNGMELYDAIRKQCHGRSPETEYQVVFRDAARREERGRGRIILPSTEMDDPAGPPPVAAPAPQAPSTPQAPTMAPQMPPMMMGGPVGGAGPYYPYQPPPPPPPPPPQPAPAPMSPPMGSGDPVVIMQLQKQLSDIQGQLAALNSRPQPAPPPPPPPMPPIIMREPLPHAPMPMAQPTPPAPPPVKAPEVPPGYALTTMNGLAVLVPLSSLFPTAPAAPQGVGVGPAPPAAPAVSPAAAAAAAVAPPPLQSPVEQFSAAIGMVRGVVEAAQSINAITGGGAAPITASESEEKQEEELTKVVKMGDMHLVQNKEDGSLRLVDTAVANMPKIMGWLDKQRNDYIARQDAIARGQPPPPPSGTQDIGAPPIPGR